MDKVTGLAQEEGVVIFSESSCSISYSLKIMFKELGIEPMEYEIDQDPDSQEIEGALVQLGCSAPVPAVFIGGKLMGSTNEITALHLNGSLAQMVKPYLTLN